MAVYSGEMLFQLTFEGTRDGLPLWIEVGRSAHLGQIPRIKKTIHQFFHHELRIFVSEAREQSGEPTNWHSHLALSHQQLVSPGDVFPNLQHNLTQTESNISDTNKEIISIVQRANETNYPTPSALVQQTSHIKITSMFQL